MSSYLLQSLRSSEKEDKNIFDNGTVLVKSFNKDKQSQKMISWRAP